MIKKIISGGQTGADQGALDTAIRMDIPHGGWVPKGRLTEAGPLPSKYRLIEMATGSYAERTEKNVLESHGTLVLTHGPLKGGAKLTVQLAEQHGKPHLHIDLYQVGSFQAARTIIAWVRSSEIETLNVAGTRASEDAAIYSKTTRIIETVLYLDLIEESGRARLNKVNLAEKIPASIDEAIVKLVNTLPLKDRATISNMSEDELPTLFETLGNHILMHFRLYSGNPALLASCQTLDGKDGNGNYREEEAAMTIIHGLWKELKRTHSLRIVK